MIRDLADAVGRAPDLNADVLVIGAGIAGLLVATRLARAGKRVVVVESGALTQPQETHPLNEVEQLGDPYDGAENGRFRCLGGTSTRWGGAMLPFLPADFTLRPPGWDAEWPIALEALTKYQREVERIFGLHDGPYDFPDLMPGAFLPRRAKWPPFRMRNVAATFETDIKSDRGPEIWLNATATAFGFNPAGLLENVAVRSLRGGSMTITARQFVVAAGAIESTRLLLLADRQHGERIFAPDKVLGRYFYDHLSVAAAKLIDVRAKPLNRVIGFSFEGAVMRNLRFEPGAGLRAAKGVSAGFVHIKAVTANPGGFDALRGVFQKFQQRRPPDVQQIFALAAAAPWLSRAAWWRFVEKRLLFPDAAQFEVHVVTEQAPVAANRIGLSTQRLDLFGLPLATIDWRVSDADANNTLATAQAFIAAWSASDLASMAEIRLATPPDLRRALAEGGGIYHPGGSIRMGGDAARGVVDSDFASYGVPNISVVSTATFPSGGGANPTMMLMMAALRAAEQIATRLN